MPIFNGDSDRQMPVEYLAAIGRVAVLSANLEQKLASVVGLIAAPLDHATVKTVLLSKLTLSQLIDRLEALVKRATGGQANGHRGPVTFFLNDHLVASLSESLRLCKAARTGRNRIIHANWYVEDDSVWQKTGKSRSKGSQTRVIEVDELTNVARQLQDAGDAASSVTFALLSRIHDFS